MATYMFVLYFGIAADLSPPVALAAYAGAGIAGADPMRTGMNAVKLALAGFLVPYIYVFNPILVLVGVESKTALLAVLVVVVFGIALLSILNREKTPRVRIAWGAAAALSLAVLAYLIHGGEIPLQFVLAIITALIGVFLLGMSTVGYYKIAMPSWMRALALGGALGLLVPGIVSDSVGIFVLATIHLFQTARARKGQMKR